MNNTISNSHPREWLAAMREIEHEGDVEYDLEHQYREDEPRPRFRSWEEQMEDETGIPARGPI